jgi:transposase
MTSRRKFTKEFKKAAVSGVDAGQSLSQLARALEVHPADVHRWKRALDEHGARAFQGSGHRRAEQDKVAELERKIGQQTGSRAEPQDRLVRFLVR